MESLQNKDDSKDSHEKERFATLQKAAQESNGNLASFDSVYVEISQPRGGLDKALLQFFLASQQKHLYLYDVPLSIVALLQTSFLHKESVAIGWANERPHGRDLAGDLLGVYFYARATA
jgi:hypothetical protein